MTEIPWGNPVTFAQHGIAHLRTVSSPVDGQIACDYGFEYPFQRVFWAKLDPGGFIVPHVDSGPYWERWHIPVQAAGVFWQNGEYFEPEDDVPFRVKHWEPHGVFNPTDRVRIHVIVDLGVAPVERPEYQQLSVTEMIPEIQEMIDEIDNS